MIFHCPSRSGCCLLMRRIRKHRSRCLSKGRERERELACIITVHASRTFRVRWRLTCGMLTREKVFLQWRDTVEANDRRANFTHGCVHVKSMGIEMPVAAMERSESRAREADESGSQLLASACLLGVEENRSVGHLGRIGGNNGVILVFPAGRNLKCSHLNFRVS